MPHKTEIPVYAPHGGTIRFKGDTRPADASRSAMHCLMAKMDKIDFIYIGANAGQQAMKAMGIFRLNVEFHQPGWTLAFRPLRFQTEIEDFQTKEKKMKDLTVWRTILVERPVDGDC